MEWWQRMALGHFQPAADDKAAAFDALAVALTHRWADGQWCWYCHNPSGGSATMRATQAEAVADLVAWAERTAKQKRKKRIPLA